MRCAECKHFLAGDWDARPAFFSSPFGSCARWFADYGVRQEEVALNECVVESDEGWCMVVGPDFGCVLFESNSDS